jgi:AraC-like DNA-binding protein
MDIKKFVLSYYKKTTKDFNILHIIGPAKEQEIHSHNYFQITYVLSGTLLHNTESGSATLSSGDLFILPPNLPHSIELKENKTDFFSLSFLPEFIQNSGNKMVSDFLQTLISCPTENIPLKLILPHREVMFVEGIFKRIHREFSLGSKRNEPLIRECVLLLLTLFGEIFFEKNAEKVALEWEKETALHCIEYVNNHFDENITLDEMARRFALSRTSFCNLFLSVAGSPFKEYLNTYRIRRAAEMLRSGEKASSVAEKCGFGDFSTFYRNFKKQMGQSPTKYRLSAERDNRGEKSEA